MITEVELSIIPQDMVTRVVTNMDFWEFVQALHQLQSDYNAALNGTGPQTVAQVLASYEGTQVTADLYALHAPPEMHRKLLEKSALGRALSLQHCFSPWAAQRRTSLTWSLWPCLADTLKSWAAVGTCMSVRADVLVCAEQLDNLAELHYPGTRG